MSEFKFKVGDKVIVAAAAMMDRHRKDAIGVVAYISRGHLAIDFSSNKEVMEVPDIRRHLHDCRTGSNFKLPTRTGWFVVSEAHLTKIEDDIPQPSPPTPSVKKPVSFTIYLECVDPAKHHNKFYEITCVGGDDVALDEIVKARTSIEMALFCIYGRNGRIGKRGALNTIHKPTDILLNWRVAWKQVRDIVSRKVAKGYKYVSGSVTYSDGTHSACDSPESVFALWVG